MNIKELTYFLKTYEYKSIKKAADSLFISSQGLSKMINKLEEELEIKLFFRTSHGMEPTAYADKLRVKAETIVSEFESVKQDVVINKSVRVSVLRIASTYGVLKYLTLNFIRDFYAEYPDIRLNFVEFPDRPIETMIREEQVELGFLPAPIDANIFDAQFCTSHRHCLVINKQNPLSKKVFITYQDLKDVPIAIKGREFTAYNNNINRFIKAGVNPNILLETSEEKIIYEVAEKNMGIGVLLDFIAYGDKRKDTVIKPFADKECVRDVYLVGKKSKELSNDAACFKIFTLRWIQHNRDRLFHWVV